MHHVCGKLSSVNCFILIFFSLSDNLGVCLGKEKGSPDMIIVLDCLVGKEKVLDVNVLAAR